MSVSVKDSAKSDARLAAARELRDLLGTVKKDGKKVKVDYVSLWADTPDLAAVRAWIPTRFPWFDWMLSNGRGIPVGRAIQLWGEFSACKSSFAQALIKPWQDSDIVHKDGGLCVYFDTEFGVDPVWLRNYGVDEGALIYANPETVEEIFDDIFATINETKRKNKRPVLMVWDSVAQSLPSVERDEKSFANQSVGVMARAFSKGCRKLPRRLSRCNSSIIFINQTRNKIGGNLFGDPNVRPGGQGLDFASAAIVRLRKSRIKQKVGKVDVVTGFKVTMSTPEKNRLTSPFRQCEIIVDFKRGACPILSTQHLLKTTGMIVAAGSAGSKLKGGSDTFKRDEWPDFMRENKREVRKATKRALAQLSKAQGN